MAKEALELIKKAESDAGSLIEEAKILAEKNVLEAKAQKKQELLLKYKMDVIDFALIVLFHMHEEE